MTAATTANISNIRLTIGTPPTEHAFYQYVRESADPALC
jgi:hypothetical protein